MEINNLKDFTKVVGAWKRNENNGRPTLQDIAIVYAWNDVPEEVMVDVISYYKYENISGDLNDWKNKVLFNK